MRITFILSFPIIILSLTTIIECFTDNLFFNHRRRITTSQNQDTSKVSTHWISQPVDQFNPWDKRTFNQKYLVNLEFSKNDGPVYIFMGEEQEVWPGFLLEGYIYDLASETNGALYSTEHRYYGESNPLDMNGPDYVANLKYLSSRQALADTAKFIIEVVKHKHPKSKVVVIGGSYAGNLATWMKEVYPHLVDAAIASSAPILAKYNFYEYLETVTTVIQKYGGPECYDYIKNMIQRYSKLLATDEGIAIIQKDENLCSESDLSKLENKQYFMKSAQYRFNNLVQYAYNEKEVEEFCNEITSNRTQLGDIYTDFREPLQCDLKVQLEKLSADRSNRNLRWVYQTCTEFSYSMTTTSSKQIFSSLVPDTFKSTVCKHLFGDEFTPSFIMNKVKQTNDFYKGLHPNVTHVVFYNGEFDPWHSLSVLEDFSHDVRAIFFPKSPHAQDVRAIFVPKSSHAQDLSPAYEDDPEGLAKARQDIKNLIKEWIGIHS